MVTTVGCEAIRRCRDTLAVDPHFPKIQSSLPQLLRLTSTLDHEKLDDALVDEVVDLYYRVDEVIDLYYRVGWPSQETAASSQGAIRCTGSRAATIADEILQDTEIAVQLFIEALHLDEVDTESTIAAFAIVMPMILSSVLEGNRGAATTIAADGSIQTESSSSSNQDQLQQALYFCDYVSVNCPDESIVDEYKGATLRKMKEPHLAFTSPTKLHCSRRAKPTGNAIAI